MIHGNTKQYNTRIYEHTSVQTRTVHPLCERSTAWCSSCSDDMIDWWLRWQPQRRDLYRFRQEQSLTLKCSRFACNFGVLVSFRNNWILRCVGKISKSDCSFRHFCLSVCPPVRPSVYMGQLGSHWTDFHEIWYLRMSRKTVGKIKDSLRSDMNNGYYIWRSMYISDNISLIC